MRFHWLEQAPIDLNIQLLILRIKDALAEGRLFPFSKMDDAARLFKNSLIAGPMVRASSFLFRLGCRHYGADVVYSPGMVELALIQANRKEEGDQIYFEKESNGHKNIILRTNKTETPNFILQIVSNNGANAVKALEKMEDVISGVDLNCGCPEGFATHRGCGSAIAIEDACDVVKMLARATNKPVSAKIRVDDDINKSIQFAKGLENAGAKAIAVHGREVSQKHKGKVDYEKMKLIFESVNTYKIGNGGVSSVIDAEEMKSKTGCDSVMICKAAFKNPGVFSHDEIPESQVFTEMVQIAKTNHLPFEECKYTLQQIVQDHKNLNQSIGQKFNNSHSWESVDEIVMSLV